MWFRRVVLAALVSTLLVYAQQQPDARALLKASGEALQNFKSYRMEQSMAIEMQMQAMQNKMEITSSMAVVKPDRMRMETKSAMSGDVLVVSDGEHTWMYLDRLKQYTKKAAISGPEALVRSMVPGMGDMMEKIKSGELLKSVRILREETIEAGGQKVDCYVLEMTLGKIELPNQGEMTGAVQTLWMDKATNLAWRHSMSASMKMGPMPQPMQMKQSSTVTSLKTNVDLPDSLFAFTPPEGAKEVEDFKSPGMSRADLTGKPAANFKLAALDGKQYELEALRGKVVLLDFWATWCAPCRRDIPALEKLSQEFKEKGLVVLGLDVGEDRKTVEEFRKTAKVSYPMLLTTGADTPGAYQVTAYPTVVVVDRQGKIATYQVGSSGESGLRAGLAKVGLEADAAAARKN